MLCWPVSRESNLIRGPDSKKSLKRTASAPGRLSEDVCRKFRLHRYAGTGYDHLLRTFVPMLLEAGLSKSEVSTIRVENPRRVLTRN